MATAAQDLWTALARASRHVLPRATYEHWAARDPLHLRAAVADEPAAAAACDSLLWRLERDADAPARVSRTLRGEKRRERLFHAPPPTGGVDEAGDLKDSFQARPPPGRRACAPDVLTAAAMRRSALRPWGDLKHDPDALWATYASKPDAPPREPIEARVAAAAARLDRSLLEAHAVRSKADLPHRVSAGSYPPEGPPVAPEGAPNSVSGKLDRRRYAGDADRSDDSDDGDPLSGAAKLVLEHALAPSLHVDEKKFAKLLAESKVLATKDWRDWDWEKVEDVVDVLRRGSSLDDDDVRVERGRLAEALRTKFARRLGGFFRCDTDEPEKATHANLAWTPDRLFYGRVAGRLYTTLLRAGDFGRPGSRPNDVATFLLKDRRGQFLQSVAVELVAAAEGRAAPRSRASSSASAYVGGLFRRASSEALGEPPRVRSPSHAPFRLPSPSGLGRLSEHADEDRASLAPGAASPATPAPPRRGSSAPRTDVFDGDAIRRGLAREMVAMLLRAAATPEGARVAPPGPLLDRLRGLAASKEALARLVLGELDYDALPPDPAAEDAPAARPSDARPSDTEASSDATASQRKKKRNLFSRMLADIGARKRSGSQPPPAPATPALPSRKRSVSTAEAAKLHDAATALPDHGHCLGRAARDLLEDALRTGSRDLRAFLVGLLRARLAAARAGKG